MSVARVLARRQRWHVEHGDAIPLLLGMPDTCVDAVFGDSPYSSGGAFRGDRVLPTGAKYVLKKTKKKLHPDFEGDTRDQRAFRYWSQLWLSQAHRVARPGSPLCTFTDWRQLATTLDAVQSAGWVLRGVVPWDKTKGARPAKGRFRQRCEFIVWASKGPMPVERGVGYLDGLVVGYPSPKKKNHQTAKTVDVMEQVVAICSPGGLVLDPFTGGGSTGGACMRAGLDFLGFEITAEYTARARCLIEAEAVLARNRRAA